MRLKMDLSQQSLAMFFKPYQIKALKTLWKSNTGLSSRHIWEAVGKDTISWSSIINFLNDMVEIGLLTVDNAKGKGGYKGLYSPRVDETGTREYLRMTVEQKLEELIT